MEQLKHNIEGGCLCGAIRYTINTPILQAAICHCAHCKKQSGSAFSYLVICEKAGYQQYGDTAVYLDVGDSGKTVERHFCQRCGSPILSNVSGLQHLALIKAGTLDHPSAFQPSIEVYYDRHVEWLDGLENTEKFALSNI